MLDSGNEVCLAVMDLFGDPEKAARYNPADPYLPVWPQGFEVYTIRRWRDRIADRHLAAEGYDVW